MLDELVSVGLARIQSIECPFVLISVMPCLDGCYDPSIGRLQLGGCIGRKTPLLQFLMGEEIPHCHERSSYKSTEIHDDQDLFG